MPSLFTQSDVNSLVQDLKHQVAGEIRFDKMTRVLYSTDASIYQILPVGVVIPQTAEDVIAVIETSNRYGVPVLPRGGGTSLAGQSVGHAVVIDFSKYMRHVLEINADEGWVRTQPGIILDELNHQLEQSGMMFAPDPSTSNRGNVGGALGNNSCGAHSILWGKTIDHVRGLEVVLSNGDTTHFGPLTAEQIEVKKRCGGLEGEIYRALSEIKNTDKDEIHKRYPNIQRRVSGYNLDELVSGDSFDMARFAVGSEGTLVAITEAKLRIHPRPKLKALAVLHFNEMKVALEAIVTILELNPAAIELIDKLIINQAMSNLEYSRMMDFIEGDPQALLLVELIGDCESELLSKLDTLEDQMNCKGFTTDVVRIMTPEDQERVWQVRKAGLGLMMNVPGDAKPLPFVEDVAVSPEVLSQFVNRFDQIVRDHGTTAGYYGHASVGCLHMRPMVNLKLQEGVDRMVSISTQVSDLVLEFGGSMSGEHGDGLVRSGWNEKMFGTRLYNSFKDLKRAFDPNAIMNPGKIVDSPPMTENLRVNPTYHTRDLKTKFDFLKQGGFAGAVEMCNGQGACRKVQGGTMCPSYMVSRDEEHSTRGRANALRSAISGDLSTGSLTEKRLYDVLDLCLECKGCKAECPSNVDMAKLKYEFLQIYHKANGYPLRNNIFGNINALNRWGSFFAPLSNWAINSTWGKDLLENLVGIDRRRTLPGFANQTFHQWFRARGGSPSSAALRGQVLLLVDTFTNYNHPELGIAAIKILEKLGYQVILPKVKCCGRPMLSKGMLDSAQRNAHFNVESIYHYVQQGVKLVGLEPSCILSFKDDYVDLLSGDTRAIEVSENTMLVEEFLLHVQQSQEVSLDFSSEAKKILFQGHCHQRALVGTEPAMRVLRSIPGCEVLEIQSGCCGMAGAFGFEKEHYDTSVKIGEQALFPFIRNHPGDFVVVAEGVSCRQQIEHGTGRRAKHLIEVLSDAI